jgi:4-hydroxybenzoate polyprenyltransferase
MVKFEHTVFALPFAYVAALLADGKVPNAWNLFWITLAMVGGRTTAMGLNRIIDRFIDAENPRTRNRALPQGLIKVWEAWFFTLIAAAVFELAAYMLSTLAFIISPAILLIFVFYSYTKRFTWLSHFVLGLAIGLAPLSAWIALTNEVTLGAVLLSVAVALWVAGFDIIYACDDVAFDRAIGLHSIPAYFGIKTALTISAFIHLAASICFIITGMILNLGLIYWIGLVVAAYMLYKQHQIISPINLSRINVAFFYLNGTLSMVMFIATALEIGTR